MKFSLKNLREHKILIGENEDTDEQIFLIVDYPTMDQQAKLDELKYEAFGQRIVTDNMNKEFSVDVVKYQEYKRHFIQYTVKGWEGLPDKCELVNNALAEKFVIALTTPEQRLEHIFQLINSEVGFSEADKKKSLFADSSAKTDTLPE